MLLAMPQCKGIGSKKKYPGGVYPGTLFQDWTGDILLRSIVSR